MNVVWFQTVLSICELYSGKFLFLAKIFLEHFSADQKNDLKRLVKKVHKHDTISAEIVRKLANRGQSLNVTMVDVNDSTMNIE